VIVKPLDPTTNNTMNSMLRHNFAFHAPMRLFQSMILSLFLLGNLCVLTYAVPGEGAESNNQVSKQQRKYRRLHNATREVLEETSGRIDAQLRAFAESQLPRMNHEAIEFLRTLQAQVEKKRIDVLSADAEQQKENTRPETDGNPRLLDADAMQKHLKDALGLYCTLHKYTFRWKRHKFDSISPARDDPQILRQQQERCYRLVDAGSEILENALREAGEQLREILLGEQIRRLSAYFAKVRAFGISFDIQLELEALWKRFQEALYLYFEVEQLILEAEEAQQP
jgi:exonuclease VII large subunit